MNITDRALRLTAGALVGVVTLGVGGAVAFAAVPPFDPDPNAYGTVTFYDAAGAVITSGAGTTSTDPKYAVASTSPTTAVAIKKAALYGFLPVAGTDPGNWVGFQLSANTTYPIAAAPAPVSSKAFPAAQRNTGDASLKDLTLAFPQVTTGILANVYQIRLVNGGIGDYASASVTIDPTTGAWQQVFPNAASVPDAPTGVVATPGDGQAVVSWTPPVNNGGSSITGYVVTPFIGAAPQAPTTVGNVAQTPVVNLSNGTAYTFTVHAVSNVGPGPDAATSNAVTPGPVAPGTPGRPIATAGSASAVVSWTAPITNGGAAITGYAITPIKTGVAQTPVLVGNVLTSSVNGLTNGSSYGFLVHAINSVGAGRESAESVAVTPRVPTRLLITSAPTLSTYATAIKVVGKLTRTDTGAAVAGQVAQLQGFRVSGVEKNLHGNPRRVGGAVKRDRQTIGRLSLLSKQTICEQGF